MSLERRCWPALAWLLASTAQADGTNRHSATVSVQGDENDNRQWMSKLAVPLADHAWLRAGIGRTELAGAVAGDSQTIGAALGAGTPTFDAAVEFAQRRGDAAFKQRDWGATLNWHGARGGLGADAFLRSAHGTSQTISRSDGVFAPPATTTVRESVRSQGFGVHGNFAPTTQATVFASAMHYRYDFSVDTSATQTGTPLSSLLGPTAVLSGVWRDQAYIDRSYRVGGSYRLRSAAVSAQYFHDRIAVSGEVSSTVQLQAEFLLAGRWLVSPMIGWSSGDSYQQVGYGGLTLGYAW
jgi:hypothetical protein